MKEFLIKGGERRQRSPPQADNIGRGVLTRDMTHDKILLVASAIHSKVPGNAENMNVTGICAIGHSAKGVPSKVMGFYYLLLYV